jgi:hypothetical protein
MATKVINPKFRKGQVVVWAGEELLIVTAVHPARHLADRFDYDLHPFGNGKWIRAAEPQMRGLTAKEKGRPNPPRSS